MKLTKGNVAVLVIFLVLLVDQVSKIWIKTHYPMGEICQIAPWFRIHFIENNGMAYGIEIFNKLFLSLFRIVAVCFIGYYLFRIIRKGTYKTGYIACIALIFAGAMGNIIDSVFYGVLFDNSWGQVATMFTDQPYGTWFHGRVVDMLYFPLFSFVWPQWIPFIGGNDFEFFRPIFNIADSAITVGVIWLLICYRKYLS